MTALPATLAALLDAVAAAQPRAAALIDGETVIDFAELAARSRAVAGGLAARGVGPGDGVALWLPNGPACFELLFACARLGATAVAVNTRFRSAEVADLLYRSRARLLAYDGGFRGIDFAGILADVDPAALDALETIVDCGAGPVADAVAGKTMASIATLARRRAPRPRARRRKGRRGDLHHQRDDRRAQAGPAPAGGADPPRARRRRRLRLRHGRRGHPPDAAAVRHLRADPGARHARRRPAGGPAGGVRPRGRGRPDRPPRGHPRQRHRRHVRPADRRRRDRRRLPLAAAVRLRRLQRGARHPARPRPGRRHPAGRAVRHERGPRPVRPPRPGRPDAAAHHRGRAAGQPGGPGPRGRRERRARARAASRARWRSPRRPPSANISTTRRRPRRRSRPTASFAPATSGG